MQLEQPHLSEPFAALGAEEGPFSGVNTLMSGQIPRVLEGLLAILAGVRTLACVRPLVTGHVRGSGESFATLLAHVGVWPVVDGERLGEVRTLDGFALGDWSCLSRFLELVVLLGVALLDVLHQEGLLHVEEGTLGAGKDLGGHLHSSTLRSKVLKAFVVLQKRSEVVRTGKCLPAISQDRGGRGQP